MSSFYLINGGIFNSNVSCIVYTQEENIEEFIKQINVYFSYFKLGLKKATSTVELVENKVNIGKMTNITDEHFNKIMNKLLQTYFVSDVIKKDGIESFNDDNYKNEKLGYKNLFGIDCWFICVSVSNIKKVITTYAKESDFKCKYIKYPFIVKEKKTRTRKTITIEDSDSDDEKQKTKRSTKITKSSKTVKKEKPVKSSQVQSESLEISDDEDNGIPQPVVTEKPKSTNSKINKKPVEVIESDNEIIEEEMISTITPVKKDKRQRIPEIEENSDDDVTEEYDSDVVTGSSDDEVNSEDED